MKIAERQITAGCSSSPPRYCPDNIVDRTQAAVFLLRAKYSPNHSPPPATGNVFTNVPDSHWAAAWIEQFYAAFSNRKTQDHDAFACRFRRGFKG